MCVVFLRMKNVHMLVYVVSLCLKGWDMHVCVEYEKTHVWILFCFPMKASVRIFVCKDMDYIFNHIKKHGVGVWNGAWLHHESLRGHSTVCVFPHAYTARVFTRIHWYTSILVRVCMWHWYRRICDTDTCVYVACVCVFPRCCLAAYSWYMACWAHGLLVQGFSDISRRRI